MVVAQQELEVAEAIRSDRYNRVLKRVLRQLIESVLYEDIVAYESASEAESEAGQQADALYRLHGQDEQGRPVVYQCRGRRRLTFGRIRLTDEAVIRICGDDQHEVDSIEVFIAEVLGQQRRQSDAGHEQHESSDEAVRPALPAVDKARLRFFIQELEQTLFNDTLAQFERMQTARTMRGKPYDELEGDMMDGHPYHPSYKSRIGFDYVDQFAYGPEFKQPLQLIWLAVCQDDAFTAIDPGMDTEAMLAEQLGQGQLESFRAFIASQGCDPARYALIPVHPWQWRKHIAPSCTQDIHRKRMIVLGRSRDVYTPQQSIRTLANRTHPRKPSVKLSMNLLNTSSSRHLPTHYVLTAPVVSAWLQQLVDGDPYLKEEAKLILLREFAGASYEPTRLASAGATPYGALGCIWRESVHQHLQPGEEAAPFNSLCAAELDDSLFIEPWLQAYGIEAWLTQLFETCVLPIVHLLVAHGISLETHAQNMVLVHKDGWPVRVALKDFHEDVLYWRPFLNRPDLCPDFAAVHDIYKDAAPNAFFEMDSLFPVRVLTLGALFFINLGELALTLADRCGFEETRFWRLAVDALERYRSRFPHLEERFQQVNLFVPTTRVEQLTKRRLYPDREQLTHEVPNPLYVVGTMSAIKEDHHVFG